jgi:hypothetical protein
MAKPKVNKTTAVREYLKTHRKATAGEISAALTKQGIKISPNYVANIKVKVKSRRQAVRRLEAAKSGAPTAAAAMPAAAAEASAKASNAITLEHIKAVSQMVKTIGGFSRLHEMLSVIKEVGGLKKFKDLLDAMAVSDAGL